MRIVAFSDFHGNFDTRLNKWFFNNPGDILLFAGDLQRNSFDDGSIFFSWINTLPYTHKIMIFGNHDGNYDLMTNRANKYKSIKILDNSGICIDGINIWGSPYTPKFGNWWFMLPDNELAYVYGDIPDNTNILLTHTPMFGILDKCVNGTNAGSTSLLERYKQLKNVKYHICGHIHESYGKIETTDTKFMNVSVCDENYNVTNMPVLFSYGG